MRGLAATSSHVVGTPRHRNHGRRQRRTQVTRHNNSVCNFLGAGLYDPRGGDPTTGHTTPSPRDQSVLVLFGPHLLPGEVLPKGVVSSVGSAGSDHRHAAGWVASRGSQGLKIASSTVNYYKVVALRGWAELRSLMLSVEPRNRSK